MTPLDLARLVLAGAVLCLGVQHLWALASTRRLGNGWMALWSVAAALFLVARHVQHEAVDLDTALLASRAQFVLALLLTPLSLVTIESLAGRRWGRGLAILVAVSLIPVALMATTDAFVAGDTTFPDGAHWFAGLTVSPVGTALFAAQTGVVCALCAVRLPEIARVRYRTWTGAFLVAVVGLGFANDLLASMEVLPGPVWGDLGFGAGALLWGLFVATLPQRELAGLQSVVTADEQERQRLEAQLAVSERLASVGLLASGIAHEINNPLTYVLGNVELVALNTEPGSPGARRLAEAREGLKRIAAIVHDLQSFAREADEEPTADPRQAIDLALRMGRHRVQHIAAVILECPDTLPRVQAHEGRLSQVVLNLLINAAQAIETTARRGTIRVTVTNASGTVQIDIEDDGPGIPREARERVFEPFFTTKPQGVGTGLGLWVSHNLVTSFGGELELEDTGHGTLARIRLGRVPTAPPPPRRSAQQPTTPQGLRVLVIDDEELVAHAIARLLSGHDVAVMQSGEEGLAAILTGAWDVVFCDMTMPGVDGVDIHERVATERPDLLDRIVFMTGGTPNARARGCYESLDAAHRLDKPLSRDEITEAITRLTPGAPQRSEAPD